MERIRWKKRPSDLEQTARKRRYRHLAKVAREQGFHKVALAHHRDDGVETFLLNLVRGSGPKGLGGLQPKRDIYIRPMLECTHKEILEYLKRHRIPFFTDTSNEQLNFRRNRIRKELIPYIEKHFNPAFSESIHRTAQWMAEQERILLKLLQPYRIMIQPEKHLGSLNRSAWLKLEPELQKALLRLILPEISPELRLSSRTLQSLVTSIQGGREIELPGFVRIVYSGNAVHFQKKKHGIGFSEIDVPVPGKYQFAAANLTLNFSVETGNEYSPSSDVAFLDADKASFPLYIRNWKKGDAFRPLGLKGHKKLSDFLIDRKVPRNARKLIPLVYKDDDLIWVAGYQIHHDYRVTDTTERLLRIEVKKDA